MTGQATERLRPGIIVLAVAVLLAGAAIGVALSKHQGSAAVFTPVAAADSAANDPLTALQSRVAEKPQDAAAWQALGEEQFNRGAFGDAVAAFEKAAAIAPKDAMLWAALGEARVMASKSDPLPAEALADFHRAQAIDPKDPRSRYFLAVQRDITGDHQGAIADWLALLKDTPAGAPWQADLRRTIEQVGKMNHIDVAAWIAVVEPAGHPAAATPVLPGPSAQDLSAASKIPPSEQRAMATGMVERLETRLKSEPKNLDGWVMLMRSRINLAQPDKASQALKDALAANPEAAEQLRGAARELGIR